MLLFIFSQISLVICERISVRTFNGVFPGVSEIYPNISEEILVGIKKICKEILKLPKELWRISQEIKENPQKFLKQFPKKSRGISGECEN